MTTLRSHPPSTGDIASYYDETLEERLRDYVNGNQRIDRGLRLVNSFIDHSTEKMLEIGCGLGIAASELARVHKSLRIHGVDISPATISAARRLFGDSDRLEFEVSDMSEIPRFAPYCLITLLDVYEHIPRENRARFNSILGRSLSAAGSIVLTVPSPLHQEHLARTNPAGLQVVDEVVEPEALAALAKAVSGHLVYFSYVSVWHTNDYLHAVICRGPRYQPLEWQRSKRILDRIKDRVVLWLAEAKERNTSAVRRRLVQDRLGITL